MAQITVDNLTLGYEGRAVVRGLSFAVEAGDCLCIVGENGSGKSTLMKTLLGLQPPLGGTVRFGDGLTRRELGYLPQQTDLQRDFPALVGEIVLSGFQGRCGLRPFYTRAEKAEAARLLHKVGAAHLAGGVTGNCPAGSSSGCCWPGPCVRPARPCCWTSRSPAWTRRLPPGCTP